MPKYLQKNNVHQYFLTNIFSFSQIKPLLQQLNINFMKWGICRKHLCIDETIVPYFGRSSLKQFIRGKPVRFGFKMWCLADETGFCYQTSLYTGRDSQSTSTPLGSRVVNTFVTKCISSPDAVTLTFDNFFTSIELLSNLSTQGIRASGTVRKNRLHSVPLRTESEMKRSHHGAFDHRCNS